jgi:glycosyltransferase involved in cell wall biosynthesis
MEVASMHSWACGPVTVLYALLNELVNMGHTITVFSPGDYNQEIGGTFQERGIQIFSDQRRFVSVVDEYELVHFHGVLNPCLAPIGRLCRDKGIPYIVSPHGNLMPGALSYHRLRKRIALNTFIQPYLRSAMGFHALTHGEGLAIRQIRPGASVTVIPNGVDMVIRSVQTDDYLRLGSGCRTIGFLGRIDIRHKGLDLLINGANVISQHLAKSNTRIMIAGPPNSKKDKRLLVRLLEKTDSRIVIYVGPQYGESKERFFEQCDLFVHTSRTEGMPMAVLEAMVRGKPCIVTEGTNMGNIIRQCKGGIVCSTTIEGVADALVHASNLREEELANMGSNCYEWATCNLAWSHIAEQYLEMYQHYCNA